MINTAKHTPHQTNTRTSLLSFTNITYVHTYLQGYPYVLVLIANELVVNEFGSVPYSTIHFLVSESFLPLNHITFIALGEAVFDRCTCSCSTTRALDILQYELHTNIMKQPTRSMWANQPLRFMMISMCKVVVVEM